MVTKKLINFRLLDSPAALILNEGDDFYGSNKLVCRIRILNSFPFLILIRVYFFMIMSSALLLSKSNSEIRFCIRFLWAGSLKNCAAEQPEKEKDINRYNGEKNNIQYPPLWSCLTSWANKNNMEGGQEVEGRYTSWTPSFLRKTHYSFSGLCHSLTFIHFLSSSVKHSGTVNYWSDSSWLPLI